MASRHKKLRRFLLRTLPIAAAVLILFTALFLVSDVEEGAINFSRHYLWVLGLSLLALLVLIISIGHRLVSLVRRIRAEAPGARLAARWVRTFLALSLPPALIVYFFSAYFLTRTIDGWFDVKVEAALADSLQLGQEFLDIRTLEVRNQLRRLGSELQSLDQTQLQRRLSRRVSASGPLELTLLSSAGNVLASAAINPTSLPDRPGDFPFLQALERGEYAAAEPIGDDQLQIRVIYRLMADSPGSEMRLLQAIYPLPDSVTALTATIEREYYRYQNVNYLRTSLKQSFLLILSLVLILTVLLAMLAAMNTAKRMVAPISDLAQATNQVAGGDFESEVKADSNDELGFLVQSFNEMTRALMSASKEADLSRAELQAQGEYLETVLGSLSAGVLTLDGDGRIVTANAACAEILRLGEEGLQGRHIGALTQAHLGPFAALVNGHIQRARNQWQEEVRLQTTESALVLLCRGSALPEGHLGAGGHVVVFDDVTILNRAQRDAAWAEVARRLAHEVKNPLTPIRLAAERLRMKLVDQLDSKHGAMLERSTHTIVAQVEALKTLVDAFGDYAKEPVFTRQSITLNDLIKDVVELYQSADPPANIELHLMPVTEQFYADAGRIRQLLHNLIRNAQEACEGPNCAEINISSQPVHIDGQPWIRLEIRDSGPGFPDAVIEQPFEPYLTSKMGGTGLGLAICRKIVSEHDGRISIKNLSDGAVVSIDLPLRARKGADKLSA